MNAQGNLFGKKFRLLNAVDYQNVFDQPLRTVDKYFTVLARSNQLTDSRLGLAISKKSARRAVDRNRLKRLARESFRIHKHELAKLDFVVMAKYAAVNADNSTLYDSLLVHWKTLDRKFSISADK